jgi:ParB family chromosome partitioning protein
MSKLDKLRQAGSANAAESMGAGVPGRTAVGSALHGATNLAPVAVPVHLQGVTRNKEAALIAVDKIAADPGQPREEFDQDELVRLSESLKSRGQLQPITVYWEESRGLYTIVCGERRWRAAQMAGLPHVTATILPKAPEAGERLAIQLVENVLRADLTPLEQAKGYSELLTLQGCSAAQLARDLAITESKITRALSLLDLPDSVKQHVEQGTIAPASAYEISKVESPEEQKALAEEVVSKKLTREQTAKAAKTRKRSTVRKPSKPRLETHEFHTTHGKVTVTARSEEIISALEEALTRARASRAPKELHVTDDAA